MHNFGRHCVSWIYKASHEVGFFRECRALPYRRATPLSPLCSIPVSPFGWLSSRMPGFAVPAGWAASPQSPLSSVPCGGTEHPPAPLRLASAKSHACIFCSFVNALTTKMLRYQLFAVLPRFARHDARSARVPQLYNKNPPTG